MSVSLLLKLLHIVAGFWMIAGLLGRTVTMYQAGRARDIQAVCALLPVAAIFERRMVIPGSNAVLLLGLITAWAQGWPILGFLQGAPTNWVLAALLLMLSIFPVIIFIFLPRAKRFERAFQGAVAQSQVTPALTAAFHDPLVRLGHWYEFIALAAIITLMVLKPF